MENENANAQMSGTTPFLLLSVLFALHTFLLMGTGTWSDLAMEGEDFASTLYYVREAMLLAGFLLYAAVAQIKSSRLLSPKGSKTADMVLVVAFAACTATLHASSQPAFRVPAVLMIAVLIGLSGGMVYERIALLIHWHASNLRLSAAPADSACRMLGLVVGGGDALAVALQFALQTGFSLGGWLDLCFAAGFALLIWLVRRASPVPPDRQSAEDVKPNDPNASQDIRLSKPILLAYMVVATACLFSLLPFYEAAIRASGTGSSVFYEWHRLFLAAGYLVIGLVTYRGGRPAASMAIVVLALFAIIVLVQTALLEAGSLTAVLFYFLLSAMLAWSAITFMSAAAGSSCPAFVASTWRVLSGLVTLSGSLIQAVGELSLMTVLTISLVLLAVVMVTMVRGGFFVPAGQVAEVPMPPQGEPTPPAVELTESSLEGSAPSIEERLQLLAQECDLTEREREVLSLLVLTEMKNQQIADEMGISRRQLQTHISRIYGKTDVSTRAGLTMRVNGEGQTH